MSQITSRGQVAQFLARVSARARWLQAPAGLLVLLLQRTPVLRVSDPLAWVAEVGVGNTVRALFGLAALGACDSLAGASGSSTTTTDTTTGTTTTVSPLNFAVTNGTPASGPAGTIFTVTGNVGVAFSAGFTLSGGITNPKSWSVTGTLPAGLGVVGGNPVNVGPPYKLTLAGTPTAVGNWNVTINAYDGAGETGTVNTITCDIVIAQNTAVAPTVTTQPTDVIGVIGGSVSFTAAAAGLPAPVYQWYHDFAPLAGQTAATLTLSSLKGSDAGSYVLTATNAAGTVSTAPANLTVNAAAVAPTLTAQPQSTPAIQGYSVNFTAAATGTFPLAYQWNKDGTPIAGATSSGLTLPSVQLSDAGNYTVTVMNSAGSVTSLPAQLTVSLAQIPLAILTAPQSTTVTAGAPVTFTASANGTAPLSYQWSKDGIPLAGATGTQYAIPLVRAADAGSYTWTVTNGSGSVTSAAAVLTVNAAQVAPTIVSPPQAVAAAPGAAAGFAVVAIGSDPLAYQWLHNGTAIAGATAASYAIAGVQAADAGPYAVVVSNASGTVTSAAATLTVSATASALTAPAIVTQPGSDTVAAGHSVSFSATTSGNPAAGSQWQVSKDGGATWTALANDSTYSGAATGTLTISNVSAAMSGYLYRLTATNGAGTVASSSVTLTVAPPPFPGPGGIVVDSAGDLFVSDIYNSTVQFVTPAGAVSLLAGTAGQLGSADGSYGSALFRSPRGIALDAAENLYVADSGNAVIRKITPAGVVSTVAGSDDTQGFVDGTGTAAVFNSPQAVAVDGAGNLYVADTGNSAIRKITPAGDVTTLAGNGSRGYADGTGLSAMFNQPSGLVLDAAGNVYVADTFNDIIRRITPTGTVTTWAGVPGVGGYADGAGVDALFNQPTGLAIDSAGNVYVADTGNGVIRLIKPDGTVRALAGLPTVAGLLDGTGTNALFNQPEGVSLDASGNLFVTDNGNAAIRKVTSAGVVTTLVLKQTTTTPAVPVPASSGSTGSTSGSSSGGTASGGGGAIEPRMIFALLLLAAGRGRRRLGVALRR